MEAARFGEADREQLAARGISLTEAQRQLDLFRHPPAPVELIRACTVGDGIERIPEEQVPERHAAHEAAAREGRFFKFVPASGAATRLFRSLIYYQRGGGRKSPWAEIERRAGEGQGEAAELVAFLETVRQFPFYGDLQRVLARRGEDLDGLARSGAFRPILDALLDAQGLGYHDRPKGLLKFHEYPGDDGRTAFEEHLIEATDYVKDERGVCRVHFTVSAEHRASFERLFEEVQANHARRHEARFYVGYSEQKPSTDTLAVDDRDRISRQGDDRLSFRPGGHGALIENLNDLDADLVFIKNIDNVQPDRLRPISSRWKKALGGHLALLQREVFRCVDLLREAEPPEPLLDEALDFARRRLSVRPSNNHGPLTYQCKRASLIGRLNRPLRVCGVVPDPGEPGGGPFWVRGRDGTVSLQIVEGAQVDPGSESQQRIFRSSTHFNPVDLVCGLRDAAGRPFDLRSYVDEKAVIITHKSQEGRELQVLERPGLWNGAMAGWNTVFVEVPGETFSPVKGVLDLLRDEHRGG